MQSGRDEFTAILTPRSTPIEVRVPKDRGAPAVQMSAWHKPVHFERVFAGVSLTAGMSIVGYRSVFGQGEGMAPSSREGYTEIFLSEFGHHYYIDERLTSANQSQDRIEISRFYDLKEKTGHEIAGQTQPLYLVFFLNNNGNGCIDRGEFEVFILYFQ